MCSFRPTYLISRLWESCAGFYSGLWRCDIEVGLGKGCNCVCYSDGTCYLTSPDQWDPPACVAQVCGFFEIFCISFLVQVITWHVILIERWVTIVGHMEEILL